MTQKRGTIPQSLTGERVRPTKKDEIEPLFEVRSAIRTRPNPGASKHAPTYSQVTDVDGQCVPIIEICTTKMSYTGVRVEPEVQRTILRAPSLWEGRLEHELLTHALRVLQVASLAYDSPVRRNVLESPIEVLRKTGLGLVESTRLCGRLGELKLVEQKFAHTTGSRWLVRTDVHCIGPDGELKKQISSTDDPFATEPAVEPERSEVIVSSRPTKRRRGRPKQQILDLTPLPRHKLLGVVHQTLLKVVPKEAVREGEYLVFVSKNGVYGEVAAMLGRSHHAITNDTSGLLKAFGVVVTKQINPMIGREYRILAEPRTFTKTEVDRLLRKKTSRAKKPTAQKPPNTPPQASPDDEAGFDLEDFMAKVQTRLDGYASQVIELEAQLAVRDTRIQQLETELASRPAMKEVVIPEGIAKHLTS